MKLSVSGYVLFTCHIMSGKNEGRASKGEVSIGDQEVEDEVGLEEHAETRKIRSRSVCLYHKGKDCGFGKTARP